MKNGMTKVTVAFVLMTGLALWADEETKQAQHRYDVLLEVAQMKLEGQADMEVIMNAKSTTDTTEINEALDQLRKVK